MILVLLLALTPILFSWYLKGQNEAIVLQDAKTYEGPSQIYTTMGELKAGSKIIVGKVYNGRYFVEHPRAFAGWVKKEDLGLWWFWLAPGAVLQCPNIKSDWSMKLFFHKFCSLIIFSLLILGGCSSPRPGGKTEAEVIYKEAQKLMDDGRYLLATEKLNSLRSQYPYSFYATHAELMQADILFKQENYVEAAAAYLLFKDFHPKHPQINYVVWKTAESFYNQTPSTFDRDLTPAHEAIKYYDELLNNYPDSEYSKGGKEKMDKCLEMIRDKEQYVADFYFKTEIYDAARYHYVYILSDFKDDKIREHAMRRIIESSFFMNKFDECIKYYDQYRPNFSEKNLHALQDLYAKCSKKVEKSN